MKSTATVLAAVAVGIVSVQATPLQVYPRAADAQVAPVIQCLRQHYPKFPKEGQPTDQELRNCMAASQPKAKRSDTSQEPAATDLIYEPSELTTRGVFQDVIQVLGKPLALQDKAYCGINPQLHDEFTFAQEVQVKATDICSKLKEGIEKKGLLEDGGIAYVVDQITNGHDKQGHQLKDKVALTATYMLSVVPPANTATDDVKAIAGGIYSLCDSAITRLTTKDIGCTKDVRYYRPSKAKHYTDPAILDGLLGLTYGGGLDTIAQLSVSFTNDN